LDNYYQIQTKYYSVATINFSTLNLETKRSQYNKPTPKKKYDHRVVLLTNNGRWDFTPAAYQEASATQVGEAATTGHLRKAWFRPRLDAEKISTR
jgi:hypothetical protein